MQEENRWPAERTVAANYPALAPRRAPAGVVCSLGAIPVGHVNAGLAYDLRNQSCANLLFPMRIRDANLATAQTHELMSLSGKRPVIPKGSELPNQLFSRERFGHASRHGPPSHTEVQAVKRGNVIVVMNLQ